MHRYGYLNGYILKKAAKKSDKEKMKEYRKTMLKVWSPLVAASLTPLGAIHLQKEAPLSTYAHILRKAKLKPTETIMPVKDVPLKTKLRKLFIGAFAQPDEKKIGLFVPGSKPEMFSMDWGLKADLRKRQLKRIKEALKKTPAGLVAHEAGHLTGKRIPMSLYRMGKLAPNIGMILPGLAKKEEHGRAAAIAGTALSIPMLAEEFRASLRGSKFLPPTTSKLGRLAPFVGLPSYLLLATLPLAFHYAKSRAKLYQNQK